MKIPMCISGANSATFLSKLSDFKIIGMGTYGSVARGTTKSGDVIAMKEMYVRKKFGTNQEEDISILLNKLILTDKCPNFIYTFFLGKCQSCAIQTLFSNRRKQLGNPCYIMYMEAADMDLYEYSNEMNAFERQMSVLYQILFAVYAIHFYYGIFHGDIKTENILIRKVVPGGYFKYQIGQKTVFVENAGVVAYLSDFGVSEILSPLYSHSKEYYGARNAFAHRAVGKWVPINVPGNPSQKWVDGKVKGTVNEVVGYDDRKVIRNHLVKIYKKLAIKEDPPYQLDNKITPPFEFFYDIQDVFRMFVGGKRTTQSGLHNSLPLNDKVKSLTKTIDAVVEYERIFQSLNTLKYVLAEYMIDDLYRHDPGKPKKRPVEILGSFKM
jgi:hypothetical protein